VWVLERLQRLWLYRFGAQVAELWSRHAVPRHAAALAFFTMLTLAPMLLALTGIAGYFLGTEQVASQILSAVRRGLGEQAAQGVEQLIQRTVLQGSGAGATLLGLLLALWGASGLMQSLKASLDALWDAPPHSESGVKHWVISRLIGAVGILTLAVLLVGSVCWRLRCRRRGAAARHLPASTGWAGR
jgi:Predicted membrane protein